MTLHGIKLYPLRRWTVNAAAVYQLVAGVMYNANDLVPVGVNGRFEEIIALEGKMPEGYTIGDLLNAWLEHMKTSDD